MFDFFKNSIKSMGRTAFFVLLLFILTAAMSGCGSSGDVQPREGSIAGRIMDPAGKPLQDALVMWHYDNTRWSRTDANGAFFLDGIGFGRQIFQVKALGLRDTYFYAQIYTGSLTQAGNIIAETKSFECLDIKSSEITSTSAIITWTTTDFTLGSVNYGTNEKLGSYALETGSLSKLHQVKLINLNPETEYYFRIVAKRQGMTEETSGLYTFRTVSALEDTSSPEPPKNIRSIASVHPGVIDVTWDPSPEQDIKGYKLYRSHMPDGTFESVTGDALIPDSNYKDRTASPGNKYYYYVKAVDQAGNVSGYHNTDNAFACGSISKDTVWTAKNSPYYITGDITVEQGATLVVDAGVEVIFAENDILRWGDPENIDFTVNGCLITNGTEGSPIRFYSGYNPRVSGVWNGIKFGKSLFNQKSELYWTEIYGADTAITAENTSLKAENITISSSEIGLALTNNNMDIELSGFVISNASKGIIAKNNRNLTVSASVFYKLADSMLSENNGNLLVDSCDFIDYTNSALNSDGLKSQVKVKNSLFISEKGRGVRIDGHDAIVTNNTFDTPYAIEVASGRPIIEKNLFAAVTTLKTDKYGIFCSPNISPTLVFGPNNIQNIAPESRYINCQASVDSTEQELVFMRDLDSSNPYDLRLPAAYPNKLDPWGIQRGKAPSLN